MQSGATEDLAGKVDIAGIRFAVLVCLSGCAMTAVALGGTAVAVQCRPYRNKGHESGNFEVGCYLEVSIHLTLVKRYTSSVIGDFSIFFCIRAAYERKRKWHCTSQQ